MRKYRYELKYIITPKMATILKTRLLTIMDIDSLASGGKKGYTISSLYFDDLASTAYFEKLDGVLYRTKYRIRVYDYDDSCVWKTSRVCH